MRPAYQLSVASTQRQPSLSVTGLLLTLSLDLVVALGTAQLLQLSLFATVSIGNSLLMMAG